MNDIVIRVFPDREPEQDTIISIFRESKEPYAIQDIEKVAAKRGVGAQPHNS